MKSISSPVLLASAFVLLFSGSAEATPRGKAAKSQGAQKSVAAGKAKLKAGASRRPAKRAKQAPLASLRASIDTSYRTFAPPHMTGAVAQRKALRPTNRQLAEFSEGYESLVRAKFPASSSKRAEAIALGAIRDHEAQIRNALYPMNNEPGILPGIALPKDRYPDNRHQRIGMAAAQKYRAALFAHFFPSTKPEFKVFFATPASTVSK